MKLIHILIALVLLIGGWFAWKRLPGVRSSVENTVEEYGGWTREARESDPVGFLTFAEERFRDDLLKFADSRQELAYAGERAEAEVARHTDLIAAAEELSSQFKAQFKLAESSGAWPTEFKGASYDRAKFLEQVETILSEQRSSQTVLATYREVVATAEERDAELRDRIASTKATLQQLAAQKELVRVDKLTAEADDLLVKIDELLGGNQSAISEDNGPVRSLDDLLSASDKPDSSANVQADALEFLNAD